MRIDFQIVRYIIIWHDKCSMPIKGEDKSLALSGLKCVRILFLVLCRKSQIAFSLPKFSRRQPANSIDPVPESRTQQTMCWYAAVAPTQSQTKIQFQFPRPSGRAAADRTLPQCIGLE